MDFNYYLYRHQVSLMRADAATTADARAAHMGLARGYAREIERARARRAPRGTPAMRR